VNVDPVTSEFEKGVCRIFASSLSQFDDRRLFGTLSFRNELEHYNCDCSTL